MLHKLNQRILLNQKRKSIYIGKSQITENLSNPMGQYTDLIVHTFFLIAELSQKRYSIFVDGPLQLLHVLSLLGVVCMYREDRQWCGFLLFPGCLGENLTFPDLYLLIRWRLLPPGNIKFWFSQRPGDFKIITRNHIIDGPPCMYVFSSGRVGFAFAPLRLNSIQTKYRVPQINVDLKYNGRVFILCGTVYFHYRYVSQLDKYDVQYVP